MKRNEKRLQEGRIKRCIPSSKIHDRRLLLEGEGQQTLALLASRQHEIVKYPAT